MVSLVWETQRASTEQNGIDTEKHEEDVQVGRGAAEERKAKGLKEEKWKQNLCK